MSAGGLSYSGLTNYGRVTLPSVETWGTNMNILRDPPKSVMTRRINKVGETSSITQMIDDSSNRACEAIQVYARGLNPCVSVSYNNYGNNGGGGQAGNLTGLGAPIAGAGRQAKLPYTIMKDGAFRPPVRTQEDLLPLSRLPRVWTSAFSKPGFADFSRKARACATAVETNEVKTKTLKACVRPTATYIVQTPLPEPFEVKYVIQPTLKTSATSGMRSMDVTQREVKKPTKEVYDTPLHARAQTKQVDPSRHVNTSSFNTEPYIQDTNAHEVGTNVSTNKHHTSIDEILDLVDLPVQEIRTMSRTAPKSLGERTDYVHGDIELDRNLPGYQVIANNRADRTRYKRTQHTNPIELSRNIPSGSFSSNVVSRGGSDHSSRSARLAPKLQPGGYHNTGRRPMIERMQEVSAPHETQKARTSRLVMESMQGRFEKPAPWG
jgi:hypothetical protein